LSTTSGDINLTDKIEFRATAGYENAQIWYNGSSSDWDSPVTMNIFLNNSFVATIIYNGDRGNNSTPFYFKPDSAFPGRYYGNFTNGSIHFFT